jgi:hypothetical protein
VTVLSFEAGRAARDVSLAWRSASEERIAGYRVFREQRRTRLRLTNQLVPAARLPGVQVNAWLDRNAPKGRARYWFQRVDLSGARTWHGPATLR